MLFFFFSKFFLGFTLGSVIHFDLIFVYGTRYGQLLLLLLHRGIQVF